MKPVPVHIAVLAVGKDASPTHTVAELAIGAGHKVVQRATVTDTPGAVRTQLTRWIEDPNVDVVIVSGGVESVSASAALKPLITEVLPGFTDLFRYLAFQEIGASAMLSNAEAAQCGTTFVFVLPASAGGVRAAMEKLILPQLDARTTPKNLVTQMPRLRSQSDDGIPMPLPMEKTSGGSGLSPKAPAMRAPARAKAHTGANVIRKVDPDEFDPPTKPIDMVSLEHQIALSGGTSHTSETKKVDLSRLPKLPPGADLPEPGDDLLGDDPLRDTKTDAKRARLESEPIEPPPPAAPARGIQRTPAAGLGVAKTPIPSMAKRKPPTEPPPVPTSAQKRQKTEPAAVVPPARQSAPALRVEGGKSGATSTAKAGTSSPSLPQAASVVSLSPSPAAPAKPNAAAKSGPTAAAPAGKSGPQRPAPAATSAMPMASRAPAAPAKKPPTDPPPIPAKKPPTDPPPLPAKRAPSHSGPNASTASTAQSAAATQAASTAMAPAAAAAAAIDAALDDDDADWGEAARAVIAAAEAAEAAEAAKAAATKPSTPPSAAAAASATAAAAAAASAASATTAAAAAPIARRPPTAPPPATSDFAALAAPSLATSTGDLPAGTFNYPVQKSRGKVGWILALLAMGGIGFAAVVFVLPKLQTSSTSASTKPTEPAKPVATVTADAAVEVAADPDTEIVMGGDAEEPATNRGRNTKTGGAKTGGTKTGGTKAGPGGTKTGDAKAGGTQTGGTQTAGPGGTATPDPTPPAGGGEGSQVAAADPPEEDAPVAPPIAASDCDEVACVLTKYDRPCCEKYKPKDSDLKPRVGGVPSELDKVMVRAGVEKIKPRVVACGEGNSDKGTVKIAVVVRPDGSVSEASVADAPNASLGECVATAMRKAQFGKSVNGGSFTYPFVF